MSKKKLYQKVIVNFLIIVGKKFIPIIMDNLKQLWLDLIAVHEEELEIEEGKKAV